MILIDALGYSNLTRQCAPRLSDFINETRKLSRVRTLLDYSNAIVPSIFSGMYPEEHNIWGIFKMSPESYPFKLLSLFRPSIFDKNKYLRYFATRMIYAYSKKKNSIPGDMFPVNIPIRLAKYFDISLKKHIIDPGALEPSLTLFDLLRSQGIPFSYSGYPTIVGTDNILSSTMRSFQNSSVSLCYIDEIDHQQHLVGTSSKKFIERIRIFDDSITDFLRKIIKNEKMSLMMFSDHGMRDVTDKLNLQKVIDDLNLTIGKDIVYFIDSTIARFWIFNEKARITLSEALTSTQGGHLLNDEEIRKYRINFKSNEYGDLIYLADPGKLILPNFYSVRGGIVKGMHGWDPMDELQDSFLYTNVPIIDKLDVPDVTYFFSIMRKILGI